MMNAAKWLLLAMVWLLSIVTSASTQADDLVQRVFTARDGLGSYNINDMTVDERGFVWLATQAGLFRVSRSIIRRVDRFEGNAQINDQFLVLVSSLNQRNLVVSSERQAYLYDAINNQFRTFGSADTFPEYHDGALMRARSLANGDMLLLSDAGNLWRLSHDGKQLIQLLSLPKRVKSWNKLAVVNQQILVSTSEEMRRYSLDGQQLALPAWQHNDGLINAITVDTQNRIWVGSTKGLYQLSQDFQHLNTIKQVRYFCEKIVDDGSGNLWLAASNTLMKFHPSTGELDNFKIALGQQGGLESVNYMMRDANGLLWVTGSSQPLAVITDRASFLLSTFEDDGDYKIPNDVIWSIYGSGRQLWLGGNGELHRVDLTTKQVQQAVLDNMQLSDSIFGIKELDERYLILATLDGVRFFDRQTMQAASTSDWIENADIMRGRAIFFEANIDGNWWFASSKGLYLWRQGSKQVVQVNLPLENTGYVLGVSQDKQGRIWVVGDNLWGYFLSADAPFISLYHSLKKPTTEDISISQVMPISDDKLWMSSRENGLFEVDINRLTATSLTDAWQLDCNMVYFITQTDDFRVVGCSNMLVRQDKHTGKVEAFGKSDGLITNELNESVYWLDEQQHLYAGTPDGAMKLDIGAMHKRISQRHSILESVSVYYDDSREFSIVPQSGMTIRPGAKLLSLQFSNLDYLSIENMALKYRLLKVGRATQPKYLQLDNQTQVTFAGLDAGSYRLQVLGKHDGVWEKTPLEFDFNVELFWWQNPSVKWFLLSLLMLCLVSIILYRQQQVRRFRKVNKALRFSDERLRQSLRSSDADLWEWQAKGDHLYLQNENHVLGGGQDEIVLHPHELPLHPDDLPYVAQKWHEMLAGKAENFDCEYRYRRFDGNWGSLSVKGRPTEIDSETGKVLRAAGIYSDITHTRRLEQEASLLARAFENTSEGVLILDVDETIEVSNLAAENMLGLASAQLAGKPLSEFIAQYRDETISVTSLLNGKEYWAGERELCRNNGMHSPIWLNISTINNERSQQYYVLVFSDITERKQSEAELRKLANYDSLTGLPNRTLFSTRLERAIARADDQQQKLSLLFLDLDRFKQVNDYYGHSMGDALLIEATNRLQSVLQNDEVLCRFGGDEFVILLNSGDVDLINNICEGLLTQIASPFQLFGREFFISTSIGISIWPDDARQPEVLIKNADQAMYDAKDHGRGNFQYFSRERNAEALYHLRLEGDLRRAIELNQFELHYQGQFDLLQDDLMIGAEALLRWQHPDDGYVRPDIFIKVAESCGLIIDIDTWVLKQACVQGAIWCQQMPQFRMSVNISAVHFRQPDFIDTVRTTLAETGMPAERLTLEITEGVLMKELHVAREHLQQLRTMGVEVAIDDFGTGYSSLAYLRHFEVNTLKIDRSFLIDIASNFADQAIVSSIVEIARNLKLKVVAEGIESRDQLEQAFGRGCYIIQGYYFAKPMPAPVLEQWLAARETKKLPQ